MKVLTDEQRRLVVALYRDGEHSQSSIAEMVGTTQGCVSKLLAAVRRSEPAIPRRRKEKRLRVVCSTMAFSQIGSARMPLDLDTL